MIKPQPVTVHLRRHRFLPNAGGGTCFVCVTYWGGVDHVLARLDPGKFPEFEGDSAWFVALKHPRNRFEFIRQVANKRGEPVVSVARRG